MSERIKDIEIKLMSERIKNIEIKLKKAEQNYRKKNKMKQTKLEDFEDE